VFAQGSMPVPKVASFATSEQVARPSQLKKHAHPHKTMTARHKLIAVAIIGMTTVKTQSTKEIVLEINLTTKSRLKMLKTTND